MVADVDIIQIKFYWNNEVGAADKKNKYKIVLLLSLVFDKKYFI